MPGCFSPSPSCTFACAKFSCWHWCPIAESSCLARSMADDHAAIQTWLRRAVRTMMLTPTWHVLPPNRKAAIYGRAELARCYHWGTLPNQTQPRAEYQDPVSAKQWRVALGVTAACFAAANEWNRYRCHSAPWRATQPVVKARKAERPERHSRQWSGQTDRRGRTENTLQDRGAARSTQSCLNRSPAPAMLWLAVYPTVTLVTVESLAPAMLRMAVDRR